ncbi:MAG: hypothetical protein AAF171_03040 [Cyanobacteria bacterium P01_A01_bin.116]
MLKEFVDTPTVMGFTRYERREDTKPEDFIQASREWQRNFLKKQSGIVMHRLLGNLRGQFADAIFAVDRASFSNMTEQYKENPSSKALMALIDPESIKPILNLILKEEVQVPANFSCIEFGTLQPRQDGDFSETAMLVASKRLEDEYISNHPQAISHFIGKIDENTYSEIAFAQTLGAASEICNGYLSNAVCGEFLEMFDPASFDLDFWFVLA